MLKDFKDIAIVGAGVAGARLAALLAKAGFSVRLFDYRAPWEKPCGGGMTPKVFRYMPDLVKLKSKGRPHRKIEFVFPGGKRSGLSLINPVITFSRMELGEIMIEDCQKAGVQFLREKVASLEREDGYWKVITDSGSHRADLVVGADGVTSTVRKAVGLGFESEDLYFTYGFVIPADVSLPLVIGFFKGVQGYAWVFPRKGGVSVGIAAKGADVKKDDMVERLSGFLKAEFENAGLDPPETGQIRPWLLPSLRPESFRKPLLHGEDWALIGDASGAADPITGEGMFYALQTADFLANAVESGDLQIYGRSWTTMAKTTIAGGSAMAEKFYRTMNLRILNLLLDYSPSTRKTARELITGSIGYAGLRSRVLEERFIFPLEVVRSLFTLQKGERKRKRR